MKFLYSSDIHFGFSERTSAIHESLRKRELSLLEFDAIIIAGDLGSAKIGHFESACKFLRKVAGERPIFVVLGNHDFWDKSILSFAFLKEKQRAILSRYNIINLQDLVDNKLSGVNAAPAEIDGVVILGYTGWYRALTPQTNDHKHIPGFINYDGSNLQLSKLSDQSIAEVSELAELAKDEGKQVVVVTHFGTYDKDPSFKAEYGGNTAHFAMIDGKADLFLFGHSHHGLDVTTDKGTRVFNVGGDYDLPKYVVLEIPLKLNRT